jgi:formylglycine-generating enzyme required for sulfatase activity
MKPLPAIFVSHSHADNETCDRYVDALRAQGLDVWYDRSNLQDGHIFSEEIQQELQRRSVLVVILTQKALESFWVRMETNAYLGLMAHDNSRILLPVRIGPCEVPPFMNTLKWIDAVSMTFEDTLTAIFRVLDVPLAHFSPDALRRLGFTGRIINGVEVIIPPRCNVPVGAFLMGSDRKRDRAAHDDEMPQRQLYVEAFQIMKYPVTVAEYACAVRAGAVDEPKPDEFLGITWQKQLNRLDHPVVCVSWHDAIAFAAWLAKITGEPWRLPTEVEWEKAARGTDGRIYPWGDQWDKSLANSSESMKGGTTPVGMYPNGASLYGLQDIAGNVWEWLSSVYKPTPYNLNDERENLNSTENRVLRGGSWSSDPRGLRAARRNNSKPTDFNSTKGFRLAYSMSQVKPKPDSWS